MYTKLVEINQKIQVIPSLLFQFIRVSPKYMAVFERQPEEESSA